MFINRRYVLTSRVENLLKNRSRFEQCERFVSKIGAVWTKWAISSFFIQNFSNCSNPALKNHREAGEFLRRFLNSFFFSKNWAFFELFSLKSQSNTSENPGKTLGLKAAVMCFQSLYHWCTWPTLVFLTFFFASIILVANSDYVARDNPIRIARSRIEPDSNLHGSNQDKNSRVAVFCGLECSPTSMMSSMFKKTFFILWHKSGCIVLHKNCMEILWLDFFWQQKQKTFFLVIFKVPLNFFLCFWFNRKSIFVLKKLDPKKILHAKFKILCA